MIFRKGSARNTLTFALTSVVVISLDQLSKALVVSRMVPGRTVVLIPGVLSLTCVRNPGVAFGLFSGGGQIILWLVALSVALIFAWFFLIRRSGGPGSFIALGLIVGGAVGNLTDRLFRGMVVDFLDLGWWPVFNLADVAIVAGVIIVVASTVLGLARTGGRERQREC